MPTLSVCFHLYRFLTVCSTAHGIRQRTGRKDKQNQDTNPPPDIKTVPQGSGESQYSFLPNSFHVRILFVSIRSKVERTWNDFGTNLVRIWYEFGRNRFLGRPDEGDVNISPKRHAGKPTERLFKIRFLSCLAERSGVETSH